MNQFPAAQAAPIATLTPEAFELPSLNIVIPAAGSTFVDVLEASPEWAALTKQQKLDWLSAPSAQVVAAAGQSIIYDAWGDLGRVCPRAFDPPGFIGRTHWKTAIGCVADITACAFASQYPPTFIGTTTGWE